MRKTEEHVNIENGKYTLVWGPHTHLHALRYGKPWRYLMDDQLVLAMTQEIQDLRAALSQAEGKTP